MQLQDNSPMQVDMYYQYLPSTDLTIQFHASTHSHTKCLVCGGGGGGVRGCRGYRTFAHNDIYITSLMARSLADNPIPCATYNYT